MNKIIIITRLVVFLFSCVLFINTVYSCNKLALIINYPSYNLNANTNPILDFKVSRVNDVLGCNYFVGFSKGRAVDYNRNLYLINSKIPIQLYKNNPSNNILKDTPDVQNENDCISGIFNKKDKILENTQGYKTILSLPSNIMLAGTYTETFAVNLYQGTLAGGYSKKDTKTITYTYNYPTKIDLSLVNSGAPFDLTATYQTLNFGILTTGQTQSFDIVVLSNSGYNLYFSSTNNGNLKHVNYNSNVIYSMYVNNGQVNLTTSSSNPVPVASGVGLTANEGVRIPIRVTMGEVKNQLAGQYADVIFITISSNL